MAARSERSPSVGSIGWKIRKIREYRGWSQKELGLRCGFSETTADVRIRQYESNKKVPRERALKALCEALQIDEAALYDFDINFHNRHYHALFDLEEFYGLRPVQVNNHYYLDFGEFYKFNSFRDGYMENRQFLEQWLQKREECIQNNKYVSEEAETDYDMWRYEYPLNVAEQNTEHLQMLYRKRMLEEELQAINEKLNEDA